LVERIVKFGVGVHDFLLADEGFESLAETWVGAMVLGEWTHHLWVSGNEGWVYASRFDELADELVEHAGVG
jgi:hypothetical protein